MNPLFIIYQTNNAQKYCAMSSTKWSNKVKETFQSATKPEEDEEEERGNGEPEGFGVYLYPITDNESSPPVSADETILLNKVRTPDPPKTLDKPEYAEPTISDRFNTLKKNPSLSTATTFYKNAVDMVKTTATGGHDSFIDSVLKPHFEDIKSQDAQKSGKIISKQIAMYFAIPMTYFIVLNWWHTLNYTTSTVDFVALLNSNPVRVFHFSLEPVFMVADYMMYLLLAQRLDKNLSPSRREMFRSMWDWRPVTFTLFYAAVCFGFLYLPILAFFVGLLEGKTGMISIFMTIGTILAFFKYNFTMDRYFEYFSIAGPFAIIAMIMAFIFSIIFSMIGSIMFTLCLVFYSNFALLYHNGFNPFAIYRKIKQVFDDLRDAPVKNENPEPTDYYTKFTNFLFKNFHAMFMVFAILLPIFIQNCVEATTISSTALATTIIMLNIVLFSIFGLFPLKSIIQYFFTLLFKFAFEEKKINKETDLKPVPVADEGGSSPPSNVVDEGAPFFQANVADKGTSSSPVNVADGPNY
jgi:hypothetical protein